MATVVVKPDALSLSGNMNPFILAGTAVVSFMLKKGSTILLNQTYEPGPDARLVIDVKDVVENELHFLWDEASGNYSQTGIYGDFIAQIDSTEYPFRVIRAGVANLADTAANWLKLHFLTWQPKVKPVTYYSPEWLTYYAILDCSIVLKATFEDGSVQSKAIAGCNAGHAVTCNLQYAYISGLLGKKYPVMYEVWAETGTTKLTESQYYTFSKVQSEDEQWFLFENSLGGVDTFRAYGVKSLQAEHEHNLVTIGDEQQEYLVDTERKYIKNTGFLNDYARRWILDFFPSRKKYIYESALIRQIIVSESDVTYDSNDLPSDYSFTYQFAKRSPYLNLIRNEQELPADLTIPTPEQPDFILPPRLAELPRQELAEGVLIPAMDPNWPLAAVTTYGAIHKGIYDNVMGDVAEILAEFYLSIGNGNGGGSGDGFYHIRSVDSTEPSDENAFTALRTLLEIEKNNELLNNRFIRKDIDDYAQGNINFRRNIFVQYEATLTRGYILDSIYSHDLADNYANPGFHLDAGTGISWLEKLRVKKGSIFAGELSSPTFVSGFPNGYGWMLAPYERINAANVPETKYKMELDDLTVRGNLRVFEFIISQLRGENDNVIFAGMMKVHSIDPDRKIIYLDTEEGIVYNPFREGDILMMQRYGGMPTAENDYNVIKQYELLVTEAGVGNLEDGQERLDYIRFDNFVGDLDQVEAGDVLTRVDSLTNSTRKGIMKITTIDEFGAPYQDVIYGLKTDQQNSTKVRMGNLGGLVTPYWGKLEGWGLMATHAYLKGRFMLQNGDDVLTRFEITEGLIYSEISALRTEILDQYNYLRNASFSANTDYWEANSDIRLFTVSARFLYFNDNFYADKRSVAAIVIEGDRRALRIKKSSVKQLNENFAKRPETPLETIDGEVWPTFYVSFKYKCLKRGTLKMGFPGQELYLQEEIETTGNWITKQFSAPWDGTGDFVIEFTGDIFIYSLALSDDKLENYWIQTQTKFYQTNYKIGLMAEKIDNIEGTIVQLGIDIDALEERLLIYANKTDELNSTVLNLGIELNTTKQTLSIYANKTDTLNGTVTQLGIQLNAVEKNLTLYVKDGDLSGQLIVSRINIAPSSIKIESKNINLVGAVTFNSFDSSLQSQFNSKANASDLKDMAYQDRVEYAKLGSTIVIGGYLNTDLIKVRRIDAEEGFIGGFDLVNSNLYWRQYQYGGGAISRSLRLGIVENSREGVVDIYFNAATQGGFGVKSVGRYPGGACIYASSSTGTLVYPNGAATYAGYFHGGVHIEGTLYSRECASYGFSFITNQSGGTYTVNQGVSFGTNIDLDNYRFDVKGGIIVGLYRE